MRRIYLLPILLISLSGCASTPDDDLLDSTDPGEQEIVETGLDPSSESVAAPLTDSVIEEAIVDALPTPPPIGPLPTSPFDGLNEPTLENPDTQNLIGAFASLSDNTATGVLAADFSANMLGEWTFTLAAQRGSFVLIYPTVIGCADCVFTMDQIAQAYPEFQDSDILVVMLNLYPDDVAERWQSFIDLYPGLDFQWGVVDSLEFVINYDLYSLGTVLLINPDGNLVFQNKYPLTADQFRQLFTLVNESQVDG